MLDMNELAKLGAATRLKDLAAEMETIRSAFPDLLPAESAVNGQKVRGIGAAQVEPAPQAPHGAKIDKANRVRKPLSAAQRAEIGARMKKYWAAKRKAKKAAQAAGA